MKKILALLVVTFCVFAFSGTASAFPVAFDSIFIPSGGIVEIGGTGYSYIHDITTVAAGGFIPATDSLTSAMLNLDLTGSPGSTRKIGISLDGTPSGSFLFSDPTWDTLTVNVAWLQTDGILNVALTRGSGGGSAKLTRSELTANGDRAAVVPEPTSMMLLGFGVLGLFGLGRKKVNA